METRLDREQIVQFIRDVKDIRAERAAALADLDAQIGDLLQRREEIAADLFRKEQVLFEEHSNDLFDVLVDQPPFQCDEGQIVIEPCPVGYQLKVA